MIFLVYNILAIFNNENCHTLFLWVLTNADPGPELINPDSINIYVSYRIRIRNNNADKNILYLDIFYFQSFAFFV